MFRIKTIEKRLRGSNHPLSRRLYDFIPNQEKVETSSFEEIIGKGIFAEIEGNTIRLGSSQFLKTMTENTHKNRKYMWKSMAFIKEVMCLIIQYRKRIRRIVY